MTTERTTIQVSVELWRWLNGKKRPGESFDDVLRRELNVPAELSAADGGTARVAEEPTDEDTGIPAPETDGERVWYRCGYCGTVFEVPGALAGHVEENHSEASIHDGLDRDHDVIVGDEFGAYPCPDCDVTFEEWEEFAAHNEDEHGRDDSG